MQLSEAIAIILPLIGGVVATAGYGAMSVIPADFRKARLCFCFAALCIGGTGMALAFADIQPPWARVFVTAVIGAIALTGLTEGLRWINKRESGFSSQIATPAVSPTTPSVAPATWSATTNPKRDDMVARLKALPRGDKDRLSEVLYSLSRAFDQGDSMMEAYNPAISMLSTDIDQDKVMEHVDVLFSRMKDTRRSLDSFENALDKITKDERYYSEQVEYILTNQRPTPLQEARRMTDQLISMISVWSKSIGKDNTGSSVLLRPSADQFRESFSKVGGMIYDCNKRLGEIRTAIQ